MAEKSSELNYKKEMENNLTKINFNDDNALLEINSANDEFDKTAPDEAEQILEKIEETRSQMSETIDAIQDKLSIANITEQVKEQVSEQIGTAVETAKDAFYDKTKSVARSVGKSLADIGNSGLVRQARENPWLLSVVGMSIGAVLVSALAGGNPKRKKRAALSNYKNFDEDRYTEQTRQKFGAEEAEKAEKYKYQPAQNSGSASIESYESDVAELSSTRKQTDKSGEEMKKNYEQYVKENPLAVGAIAFAVGAAIGYAIPSTNIENRYLGEMRDNVLEKAQTSAKDAIGTVKQTVGEARQIIAEEVKNKVEEVRSQTAS